MLKCNNWFGLMDWNSHSNPFLVLTYICWPFYHILNPPIFSRDRFTLSMRTKVNQNKKIFDKLVGMDGFLINDEINILIHARIMQYYVNTIDHMT